MSQITKEDVGTYAFGEPVTNGTQLDDTFETAQCASLMRHLFSPQAASDLNEIWYFIAIESGSVEIADRLVDSITDRFLLLARHPNVESRIEPPGCRALDIRAGRQIRAAHSNPIRHHKYSAQAR